MAHHPGTRFFAALCLWFALTLAAPLPSEAAESLRPIRIVLNNWSSQILLSKITGRIFEQMGYHIEYHTLDSHEQWGAMNRGIVHIQVEVWEGTSAKLFNRMIEAGGVVSAGAHDVKIREEWWYPSYVEELCPGLPDWQALKECYPIFAVDDTRPCGQYLAGPWEKHARARIRALGMKFKVKELEDGKALRNALFRAVREKRPIVLFNWSPNWVEAQFEGKFVEFPEYEPACESDPQWGINTEFHQDCGSPKEGWLKKGAWSGVRKTWPCAFETLTHINFNTAMISNLALKVDVENRDIDQVVEEWLKSHNKLWKSWIPESCGIPDEVGE